MTRQLRLQQSHSSTINNTSKTPVSLKNHQTFLKHWKIRRRTDQPAPSWRACFRCLRDVDEHFERFEFSKIVKSSIKVPHFSTRLTGTFGGEWPERPGRLPGQDEASSRPPADGGVLPDINNAFNQNDAATSFCHICCPLTQRYRCVSYIRQDLTK